MNKRFFEFGVKAVLYGGIMKKLLLFGYFVLSINFCVAKIYTEKTFLLSQPFRISAEHVFYDYARTLLAKKKYLWGGNFCITSFYRRDQNKVEVGQYFGRHGSNVISIGSERTDFQAANLIFSNTPSSLQLKGKLELRPFRKVRGIYFSYLQPLSKISKRLFISFSVPWIHITRRMKPCVFDEQKEIVEGNEKGIADYFAGDLEQTGLPHIQAPLRKNKIRKNGVDYKAGIGDAEVYLSYEYGDSSAYYFRSRVGLIIPSSNKPKGEKLFEPLLGNGKQWGMGTGIEAMSVLHDADGVKIKAIGGCDLRYFFSNTQKRMISFRSDDWDSRRSWAHYYGLLGEEGKRGVFPAANVLTRDVKVQQGLVFDCFISYVLAYRNVSFTCGYNFFARGAETVSVKHWDNDRYALASPTYDTSKPFAIASLPDPSVNDNFEGPIQREMLDTSVAETPATMTHKLYGMFSAEWNGLRVPVMLTVGGAGEFTQDNAALEGYELFLRVGASF